MNLLTSKEKNNIGRKITKILRHTAPKIGLKMGVLFQIQDDYLDFFGNKKTGKKIGQDIIENKKTYLFSLLLTVAEKEDIKQFIETYNRKNLNGLEKLNFVKKIFSKYKIKQHAIKEIKHMTESILGLIEKLSISQKNKKEFKKYIQELSKRTT